MNDTKRSNERTIQLGGNKKRRQKATEMEFIEDNLFHWDGKGKR